MASIQVLGSDYSGTFATASKERWMHVYPQPGKRSGAYMSGAAYDVHPLVLLNHQDDYNSASTYAHEWGHAMHQVLTNENQPYELADFSIFTTEIAAIANELLLQEYMLAGARTEDERLDYLGRYVPTFVFFGLLQGEHGACAGYREKCVVYFIPRTVLCWF